MAATSSVPPLGARHRLRPVTAVLYGTLVVGLLDITDAFVFFGLRGATPTQILQGIASGLLGAVAFERGVATAVLGALLHFFIAFMVVLTYHLASRRVPALLERPLLLGAGYGLLVYGIMYFVVLPLSAAGSPRYDVASVADELFAHVFLVGIPSALFARAASVAHTPS